MKRGANQWMQYNRDIVKLLPEPGEEWMIKDIREDGVPNDGQNLKQYGISHTVERPGYGKSNVYETSSEAYEYAQETLFAE